MKATNSRMQHSFIFMCECKQVMDISNQQLKKKL